MKKTLILTNLIWILLFASLALKSCSTDPSEEKTILQHKDGDVVTNYLDKKFNTLPLAAAQAMAANYEKIRMPLVTKYENVDDARMLWFGLEEMEHFIWLIRYYTENSDIKVDPKDLGIRIYYGQYPDANTLKSNALFSDVNPAYAGLHTVFMIPTFKKGGQDLAFDPKTSFNNIKKGAKELTPLFPENGDYKIFKTQSDDDPAILNHSNLCPPCRD